MLVPNLEHAKPDDVARTIGTISGATVSGGADAHQLCRVGGEQSFDRRRGVVDLHQGCQDGTNLLPRRTRLPDKQRDGERVHLSFAFDGHLGALDGSDQPALQQGGPATKVCVELYSQIDSLVREHQGRVRAESAGAPAVCLHSILYSQQPLQCPIDLH